MKHPHDIQRWLDSFATKHASAYVEAVHDMVVARATGDRIAFAAARERLQEVINATMGVAEVLGASQTLRRAAALYPEEGLNLKADTSRLLAFAEAPTQTLIPRVTFDEAVQDLIDRTPVTIRRAAERTAARISELYGSGRVVAFARAAEASVTKHAQELIATAMREGIAEVDVGRQIARDVNAIRKRSREWSESYGRMAFRTNLNTATTAGRFRQAQDPDVRNVIPCFRFDAIGDGDTRDNHNAGDGVILRVDNPAWNKHAPPLGYNCRCTVAYVGLPELRRMGRVNADGTIREDRVPSAWGPDAGFRHGGRPDLMIVEGAR